MRAHVAEHVKRQREQKSPPGDDSFLHSLAQILVSYPGLGQGSFVGAWSPGARPLLLQWHCMCARPADGYWFRSELGDPIWSHLLRLTRPPYGATNHTTRLWFLTDSDGIPDGCDLEQFNKPETDCLLLDAQEESERSGCRLTETYRYEKKSLTTNNRQKLQATSSR